MIGLRADFRSIEARGFDENYSSLNSTLGFKTDLGEVVL